jgi:LPXTG-motif cell wall-anchored protein
MSTVAFATNTTTTGGSITINNASKGVEYTLFRIFSATYDAKTGSVAYTGLDEEDETCPFELNKDNQIVVKNEYKQYVTELTMNNTVTNEEDEEVTNPIVAWIVKSGTQVGDPKTADSNTVVFNNLDYGYYYVTSGLGSLVAVDSNTKDITIQDKNTVKPGKDENTEYKTVDDVEVAVGDTATFTIQFNTVNYVGEKQVATYTVKDTPSNLKIDTTSLTITIGSKKYTVATNDDDNVVLTNEKDGSDTVVLAATSSIADSGLILIFNWVNDDGDNIYNNDTKVIITYQAEVMHGAVDSNAKNSAEIYYNDTKFTPDDTEVKLKTYDFKLTKVDGEDNKLANAKFNLQVKGVGKDGNDVYSNVKVVEEKNGAGTVTGYHVADSEEIANKKYTEIIVAGEVTIKGLDLDKTYQLVETEAPVGYNKLTDPWPVSTNAKVDDDGNITVQATDFADTNVVNNTGSTLPSTGGIGTTIFYVVGGVLVVAAGVLLVTKKRMGE